MQINYKETEKLYKKLKELAKNHYWFYCSERLFQKPVQKNHVSFNFKQ